MKYRDVLLAQQFDGYPRKPKNKIKLSDGDLIAKVMLARSAQIKRGDRNITDHTNYIDLDSPYSEY
ncbi:hypothetical protein HN865_00990 [Candidatus Woesearchaeota archaeon]|jgi:hypothetical protein|nr:hypothetical protein [Candidatus Woesearchaeota archaeon]MBT7237412.1 hypothetical protein [Candidatus Woesearchaeota archaeon]